MPFVGSTYQLISAGVYYLSGKSKVAKERVVSGAVGLAFDISAVGSIVKIGEKAAGAAAEIAVRKTLIGNVGQKIVGKVGEIVTEKILK